MKFKLVIINLSLVIALLFVLISCPFSPDTTAPGEVTGLTVTSEELFLRLTWTNPGDSDFSHVEIYSQTSERSRES